MAYPIGGDHVLHKVQLVEDYADEKAGVIGLCTADLQYKEEDIYAVFYPERPEQDRWVCFRGEKGIRNYFKIVD